MTFLIVMAVATVLLVAGVMRGADYLFDHVEDPAAHRRDPTAPPEDAP